MSDKRPHPPEEDPAGVPPRGRARRHGRHRSRESSAQPEDAPRAELIEALTASPPRSSRQGSPAVETTEIMRGLQIRGTTPFAAGEGAGRFVGGSPPTGNGDGNGNGNGDNGNGNGARDNGRRASRMGIRAETSAASFDILHTRNGHVKIGKAGQPTQLLTNFFDIQRAENWCLYQYRVDFVPEMDHVGVRKGLLKNHSDKLPAFIFDGTLFHTARLLGDDLLELVSQTRRDQQIVQIKIKLVGQLDKSDVMYLQFYNIMIRKCLQLLDLALLGRNFYDSGMAIELAAHRLQIWPGFQTSMRHHDRGFLYGIQVIHKVLRTESVFDMMINKRREMTQRNAPKERVQDALREEILGSIVITHYNKRTYKIDDISFNENANSTFPIKGVETSFADYYRSKYDITIKQLNQPLLISNPTKEDVRRGKTEPVKLIPELCYSTGLTDAMRQNFNLMREMGQYLFQPPDQKVTTIEQFARRIRSSPAVRAEMTKWGMDISDKMIKIPGRQLAIENVIFKDQRSDAPKTFPVNAQSGDFTNAFRAARLVVTIPLKTWIFIVPGRDAQHVDNLINTMQNVSRPLGFEIARPAEIIRLQNTNIESYISCINSSMAKYGADLQMIFTVLPNNRLELYAAIKKRCYVDYGMPSQCFVARTMQNKGLMSIATKLTVQMNCKLGGEAWHISIPLQKMMIAGFDVYHGGPGSTTGSVGALVATTSDKFGKYYSTIALHKSREEITTSMGGELLKCLQAWKKSNGELPERIVFYRDGVGEGQLQFVVKEELEGIKGRLKDLYRDAGAPLPKFTFIVVTKRINVRLFKPTGGGGASNPQPGTVVDDQITFPERYDFYMIAQAVRQGTVSPTSYNVIFDKSGLDADKIQKLTYKMCHLYYNWSGTVSVPAPCQYAHKLANMSGLATKSANHPKLANQLYFL